LGRATGFTLGAGYSTAYGYDDVGRFLSVSSSVASANSVANYFYLQNSALLSIVSNSEVAVTRAYEDHRDLMTQIDNKVGATSVSRFDYQNDAAGRRTRRIDLAATNVFTYNTRSELTNAVMGANGYSYLYDNIGNRTVATNTGGTYFYAANALNQYTQITNGGIKNLFYDFDGNLTNDGVFAFAWDGENRLLAVEDQNAPQEKNWWRLDFSYDYMSRRIGKKTCGWDKQANAWHTNAWKEVAFVYDGWNLVREIIREEKENKLDKKDKEGKKEKKIEKFTTVITNTYVWGLDLSGGLQGAGGIGGLLSVTRSTPTGTATYFPCYDANGNITDYVNTNGVVVAHREYDAFGNTIVATGPMVNDFNFWFSTKYLDQETGFYYYGYRYYDYRAVALDRPD
jgi:YD repeat-containing protein